jgi:HEAT repeat protein
VCRAAVGALQRFGDARAVEPLIGVLGDENEYVRAAAVGALQAFGDARAVQAHLTRLTLSSARAPAKSSPRPEPAACRSPGSTLAIASRARWSRPL